MFDEVMQSGLQIRFFNKPVQDDYLWDIKVFWEHVDAKTSEGFDDMKDCLQDCHKYVKNYAEKEVKTYSINYLENKKLTKKILDRSRTKI